MTQDINLAMVISMAMIMVLLVLAIVFLLKWQKKDKDALLMQFQRNQDLLTGVTRQKIKTEIQSERINTAKQMDNAQKAETDAYKTVMSTEKQKQNAINSELETLKKEKTLAKTRASINDIEIERIQKARAAGINPNPFKLGILQKLSIGLLLVLFFALFVFSVAKEFGYLT
ncbi:MAG: hypothetical protein WC269_06260 [Candidatus Gracilibacteria bacterium]|jgi:hypothetical protein